MKKVILLLAGVSLATGFILITRSRTVVNSASNSVDDLAHTLQAAWADHHTVA